MAGFEQFKQWRQEAEAQFPRYWNAHGREYPRDLLGPIHKAFTIGFIRARHLEWNESQISEFSAQLESLDGIDPESIR